ncbi:probable carbohydrate esterase At4g34215 [Olea europaea var. sylvestris]|uniref:probable carbohydrate esterase At4g34215 n=1 Tax=Olea europaea var. sylvestris TaxID=158386 RepID=UPI000C1D09BA|nr:probable carbohydrate esterase At4g34215 [Olea europaea var. sylvestris]
MWKEAHEPLHGGINALNKHCGVGPGMSFANLVLEGDHCIGVIGLVPCAIGGKWGSHLYKQLLKRANAALQDGGKIRAILWCKGESDSLDEISATMYKMRLIEFFLHIRGDLASPALPTL